jgi:hypothetical protein
MESACPCLKKNKAYVCKYVSMYVCMYVSDFPLGCCDHNTLFFLKLMLIMAATSSSRNESLNGHT